jgi:methionyl-tRNA synthetase
MHLAGNLLNRTLGLLKKNCQSTLAVDSATAAEGSVFKDNVVKLVKSLGNSCISIISILNFIVCPFATV